MLVDGLFPCPSLPGRKGTGRGLKVLVPRLRGKDFVFRAPAGALLAVSLPEEAHRGVPFSGPVSQPCPQGMAPKVCGRFFPVRWIEDEVSLHPGFMACLHKPVGITHCAKTVI